MVFSVIDLCGDANMLVLAETGRSSAGLANCRSAVNI